MSSVYECQLDLRTKLKIRLSSSGMQIDEARLPSGAEVKHFEIDFGQLKEIRLYRSDVTFVCEIRTEDGEAFKVTAVTWNDGWMLQSNWLI